jgi:prepilin-type N-terminal cleavage/methylation domain-containing protein
MLKQLQKLRQNQSDGFTIIEVLIVLAIAGLIMVVVFLAVPNLQRSQRNNARKSDANNLLQNLSEYVGNANGSLPAAACSGSCAWVSYVPQQLTAVQYFTSTGGVGTPSQTQAFLVAQAKCSGVGIVGGGARDYVVYYGIEGSTKTICTQGS